MPVHQEQKIVPYTAAQMFDLVADIERYPDFLPWCLAARKLRGPDGADIYEVAIGFRMVRENFTSKVTLERPHAIHAEYLRGPMRHMENKWNFKDLNNGTCEIAFDVNFEFRSLLLQKLIGGLFQEAIARMVHSFEVRAKVIYGAPQEARTETTITPYPPAPAR